MANYRVKYERGRNDRRDGKKSGMCPYAGASISWDAGWQLQDALIRNDRKYAYDLGRKDAKEGNNSCPYPPGTTAHSEWTRGWSSFKAATEIKPSKLSAP